MTPETPDNGCAMHIRRISDLEKKADKIHNRTHELSNDITENRMKHDLLEAEYDHLKRDFWAGQKNAEARSLKTAEGAAALLAASNTQLLTVTKQGLKIDAQEKVSRWVLGILTAVGTSTAIAFIVKTMNGGPIQ